MEETKDTMTSEEMTSAEQSFRRFKIVTALVGVFLVATSGYLLWGVHGLRTEISDLNHTFAEEMNRVRETSALDSGNHQRELQSLREELAATIQQARTSVGQAKVEAKRHAERLAKELAQKQDDQRQQIASQMSEIRDEAATRIEQVSSDVGNVKTEVATTQQELDEMVAGLKQVHGDLGVMSGRIATTAEELAALKALGERNYFEFDVAKSKKATRVGDIRIVLKNTDPKRNKFTMEVYADDKRIEKKHKTVNEPIQFYVGGRGGQPYEVVVNEVKKGRIVGYLAAPKVEMARR